ncbi:hypothetical protein H4219_000406 [Mycoemilia scoparia]|uniref:Uncharacterized protein n=1 Tax=Mycoemilia scoparia TaxID=417184 RepID=A0A9W8DWK3_9FUNG|nr:hypothetical protein H4219_000406 [Mycoemilia scoparia]
MSNSPITSVDPETSYGFGHGGGGLVGDSYPTRIGLNLRGKRILMDREILNNLPESILSVMFPQGFYMNLHGGYDGGRGYNNGGHQIGLDDDSDNDGHDDSYDPSIDYIWVDFDYDTLHYILDIYQSINPNIFPRGRSSGDSRNNNINNNNNGNGNNTGGRDGSGLNNHSNGNGEDENSEVSGATHPSTMPSWLRDPAATYEEDSDINAAQSEGNFSHASESTNDHSAFASATSSSSISSNQEMSEVSSSGVNGSNITSSTSSSAAVNYALFAANAGQQAYYQERQSIIVLREELDYFVMPASGKCSGDLSPDYPGFNMDKAKSRSGKYLVHQRKIFEPLESSMYKNIAKAEKAAAEAAANSSMNSSMESNVQWLQQNAGAVEQQLIEMLCVSGFTRDAQWGCRIVEPNRNSLTSLSMVRLREPETQVQSVANQKLLLFYKKPARKCWWDGNDVNLGTESKPIMTKIWCRRIWTLELIMI